MARILLGGIDLNGQRAQNAADGSSATDLVTLQQVQALLAGLRWKANGVKAASTGNVVLASGVENGDSLDGVTLSTGDRILLKDQTAGAENGIWVVAATGSPTRATDADTTAELENAAVFVQQGTANADKAYVQTATVTTVGTTAQVWAPFGAGSGVTAGNGLTGTTTLSVLLDTASGLIVSGTGLKIDPSVVVRKFAADCVATTNPQTFTDNLGTKDKHATVRRVSDDVEVDAEVTYGTNTTVVNFGGAPSAAQYRVIVQG